MMKINLKKSSILLVLIFFIILTMGFVSANENATDSINTEEIGVDIQPITDAMSEDDENINVYDYDDSSEILKLTNDSEDVLGISTTITVENYYKTVYLEEGTGYIKNIPATIKTSNGDKVTSGKVDFIVDGFKYTSNVNNGVAKLSGAKLPSNPGKYQFTAKYYATTDHKYYSSSTTFYYTIYAISTISIRDITCNSGESFTINPEISPEYSSNYDGGLITLTIDNKNYTLSKSKPSLSLKLYKSGTYYCKAEFGTDKYCIKSSTTFKITVQEEPNIIAQTYYTSTQGEKCEIDIYVVNSKGNPIHGGTISLNNTKETVNNGIAHFTIDTKKVGVKYYDVYYSPSNSDYKSVKIKKAFPILTTSNSILKISNYNSVAGTKLKQIKYTVKDNFGNDISPYGYFIVNGKKYDSLKDITAPKKAGKYTYNVKFVSDSILYENTTATFKITNKLKPTVKVKSVSGYENKKVKLSITVKDNLGKKVKKGTVKLKIKGKTYTVTVKNGKATKTIKIPKPGSRSIYYKYYKKNGRTYEKSIYESETYKCSAIFKENSNYLKSSSTFKITSKKKPTSIISPYGTYTDSSSSSSKQYSSSKKSSTTKKKTTKNEYGYTPTYYKPIPNLNTDLFKTKPAINPNINLKDIIITV